MTRGSILILATVLLVGATWMVSGPVFSGEKMKDKAEMAATAKITIEQAAKAATEKVSGKVIKAELEKKHGKLVWEVMAVTTDGKVTDTHIDADSGSVIETKVKN